jgi:hypothetical protein
MEEAFFITFRAKNMRESSAVAIYTEKECFTINRERLSMRAHGKGGKLWIMTEE